MTQEHLVSQRGEYTPRHAFERLGVDVRDWCGRVVDEYNGWPVYCGFDRQAHYVVGEVPLVPAWQAWVDR